MNGINTGKRSYDLLKAIGLSTVGISMVVYFFFDPAVVSFLPSCPVYEMFHVQCPGCGTQRMLHALLHLDFGAAFQYHPFFFSMIVLGLLYGAGSLFLPVLRRVFYRNLIPGTWIFIMVFIIFGICRNI